MNGSDLAIEMDGGGTAASAPVKYRNPIFDRELKTLLRSGKAFLFLAGYLALTGAFILVTWPRDAGSLAVAGAISRELFELFGVAQTVLLALLVPASMAGSVTREKETETLDLLLATPLSADQILLGKLFSGLAYLMLVVVTSTPVLMLCFLIGGLDGWDVAGLYVNLAIQGVAYGLVSLAASVYLHRTHVAIIISYLFVGALALLLRALYGDGIAFLGSTRFVLFGGVAASVSALLYLAARRRIRRPFSPVRKAMEEEDPSRQLGLVINRDRFPDRLIAPPRRIALLADGADPILDKELQSEVYGSGSLFVRLVIQFGTIASLGAMFGTIGAVVLGQQRPADLVHPEHVYLCFLIAYIMIVAPSFATAAFTQEKEFHMMESLILTLIPRRRIVWGKFLAFARVVLILTLMNSVCLAITVVLSSQNFDQFLTWPLTVGAVTVTTVAVGMFMSFHCRTTTASTISTYFVLFAWFVGPVLAKIFVTRFFPSVSLNHVAALDYLSPFLACHKTGPVPAHLATILSHALLCLGIAAVLLTWMSARFEKVMRRQAEQQ